MHHPSQIKEQKFTIPTQYWHRLEDGRVQCDVCPRFCKLHEGQRGFCFVRANQNNQIVLTSYGLSSGFCVDPIEKKPLYHFLSGTSVLSFGTAGCNLSCKFCQNWNMSKSREIKTLSEEASPEVIAFAARKLGCKSVAYTYNDPTVFMEYAKDVALACREFGIQSVAVTAGYICKEPRQEFYQYMDAANVDLKGFTERFYEKITGSQLQPVLETLLYLKKETKVWFEITNLLIPGENDSEKEIEEMTQWIVENLGPDVPLHFTAFHPDWKMMAYKSTPLSTLIHARKIALKNGLHYVYTGNLPNEEGEATFCNSCGKKIIGRSQYELTDWNLTETGHCRFCAAVLPGVFSRACPGHWGNRRLPFRMSEFSVQDKVSDKKI